MGTRGRVPLVADDEVRLRRRWSFDEDPGNYQAARPDYPRRVYEVLTRRCGLRPGGRVLEIGPGTGQVTRQLVAAGATVVAVELGRDLADRLRRGMSGREVTVVEGDFATVDLPGDEFDLAVCATAWHWLDADAALTRTAEVVRPGGWLAVWWTVFGDPQRPAAWREPLDLLYGRYMPDERRDPRQLPAAMQVSARTAELTAGGWFGALRVELLRWQHRLTPDAARRLWATFPNVRELPRAERGRFLDGVAQIVAGHFGGVVVDNYVTALYTAQRLPATVP